jgi:hypothetical protein
MADLVQRYIDEHMPTRRFATVARENDALRTLDLIADGLGRHTKVADVHGGDVQALHTRLTKNNGPVRANRVVSVASKLFSMSLFPMAGEDAPWRDRAMGNPCSGIKKNHERGKERFFSEIELAALSDAPNSLDDLPGADALRLLMLTGARPRTQRSCDCDRGSEAPPSQSRAGGSERCRC